MKNSTHSLSNELFKCICQLIEALPIPLFLVDEDYNILFANKSIKREFPNFRNRSLIKFWEKHFNETLIPSLVREGEKCYFTTRAGKVFNLEIKDLFTDKQKYSLIILREELKESPMSVEFIQSQKMAAVTQTVVTYNDRINSPLQVILGTCALMQFSLQEPEKLQELIKIIEEQVKKISEILGKMRKLSHISLKKYASGEVEMIDIEKSLEGDKDNAGEVQK